MSIPGRGGFLDSIGYQLHLLAAAAPTDRGNPLHVIKSLQKESAAGLLPAALFLRNLCGIPAVLNLTSINLTPGLSQEERGD